MSRSVIALMVFGMPIASLWVLADIQRREEKPTLALDPPVGDICGYYVFKGHDLQGGKVNGTCAIAKREESYTVCWLAEGSTVAVRGVGMLHGREFSVSWAIPVNSGQAICGVHVYRVDQGPKLVGRFVSTHGPGTLQDETLIFLSPMDPDE